MNPNGNVSSKFTSDRTGIVFVDQSKAFDRVDHGILLKKLKKDPNMPNNLLRWVANFLRDREFVVRVGNACTASSSGQDS